MNRGKRKTAWFLSIVMFLSVLFSGNVYAADDATTDSSQNNINVEAEQNTGNENGTIPEENSNIETQENPSDTEQGQQAEAAEDADQTVQDSSVQNQTETVGDNVPAEQGLINYVGVDYPYLETPADQNIVISYGDGSENVSDARLVAQKDDGNTLEMALSKKESELFLFTYSFDETASGIYKLTDFIYTQDGVEQTINLADIGIESMFGVNEEYPGYGENSEESAEEVTAQELEMSVVDVATSEVEAATADVEEAIEATEEQVDTTQVSRASRAAVTSKSDNLVVVLDPGHGGYDGGASANGLVEKNLTLKIAQYCKVELEQYNGVSVYMTRNDDRYLDIDERVNIAADTYHADVLVSIHINSASAAANGAEVYYPNANYNPSVHEPGRNLAQQIQNQLVALGLTDRGIKVRDTINDVYPDGSKQDYYGIIRYSKQHGFPGIIVEHAFISNPSDAAKLAQDSFLRQLGIADATGIANAYGLSKINVRATEKVNVSDNEKKAEVTAFVTEGKEDISKLSVAVWGNVNGQNDLRWYDLKETSNNEWKVSFDISNHGENGTYYSDLYVIRKNGFTTYLDSQTFHITSPMADVSIGAYDKASGTFELTASNIQCPSGVKKIEFPVWKEGDQAATVYWYTAKKQADGTYKAVANIKNHGYSIGTYTSHIYITGENGVVTCLIAGNCEVTPADIEIAMSDITANGKEKDYRVEAQNIGVYGGLGMEVAVWGNSEGGQNDLRWYKGYMGNEGQWYADIDISNHKERGLYYADVYVIMHNGARMCVKSFQMNITSPMADVSIGAYDKASGTFELTASNIQCPSGVKKIEFPVWKEGDQAATVYWYTAKKQADGTYKAVANIKNHGYSIGTYTSHIYITGENGVVTCLIAGNCEVTPADIEIAMSDITANGKEKDYRVEAQNIGVYGGLGMEVAVWGNSEGGQNDLRWYKGYMGNEGQWYADIDISNHKERGLYYADVYVIMHNGARMCVKSFQMNITSPMADVSIGAYDKASGTFELTASNIQCPSGVKKIEFPVWKEGDQAATVYWYTAKKQADGTYKAVANIKNHGYSIGTYTSHIYITGENGVVTCLIAGNCEVTPADIEIAMSDITANGKEKDYRVEAQNIGVYGGLGMEVAVWGNSEGGQNDLRWYKGYMGNEGQWYADIDISNHKERGLYYADVYVIMHNGARMCVKSFQMNITSPMADVSIGAYDKASGTFELTASNIQCPSGVKKIEFPVWKEGDQAATVYWYTAKKQADGTYKAVANIKNHGYSIGTYTSHIYITGENGVVTCLIAGNCEVNSTLSDGLYTIMGNAGISVNQMSSYFRSLDVTYPSLALKKGGAASIEEFCQIVYEEAVSEGVKAEVVFAQIMLETGNLQFGNDVKIEQFNFGGLGATGNGNPGCSFPDVRTGIRANVQHLKCYASNEPLNNEKVDPRWGEWLRNKAPYVQWLSIPHNPYGTGWAADEKYGESILNIINRLYN